ncbi:hypothetical protein [Asticcacaulis sp. W401b]|uniref:hypothetical protein n=1 Tax=Asticcacaulis sp. W401b TaxID=3388666 RepID=UPI00397046DB
MTTMKFEGWPHELAEAEAWCRTSVAQGYWKEMVANGDYRFHFICPFEAQRFLDRFCHTAWQLYD